MPNASLLSYLLSTLHENNSLKTYLLSLQKELSKLQQINKFLLTAQQNRDSLISELTHENKKLKNNSNRKMPNQTNPKILTEKSIEWITPLKKKEVEISSFPYLAHTANKTNQLNPKLGSRISIVTIFKYIIFKFF